MNSVKTARAHESDNGDTTLFERVLARRGFHERTRGRLSCHNANAVEAAVACDVAQLLDGSSIGVNEIVLGSYASSEEHRSRPDGRAAASHLGLTCATCARMLILNVALRAQRAEEIYVLHCICLAYEAPRLLQLLQVVCMSFAACAAGLEGRSGAQSSGLRLLQPREHWCRHVLQLDVMLCMPRACNTCSPHVAGLARLAQLAADGLHGGQSVWCEAWQPLELHREPTVA